MQDGEPVSSAIVGHQFIPFSDGGYSVEDEALELLIPPYDTVNLPSVLRMIHPRSPAGIRIAEDHASVRNGVGVGEVMSVGPGFFFSYHLSFIGGYGNRFQLACIRYVGA